MLGSTTYSSDLDSYVTAILLVGGDSDPGDVVAVVAAALASTTRNFNSDDDNGDDGDEGQAGRGTWTMTMTSGVVGSSSSSSDGPTALPVDSHDPSLQPRRRLIRRTTTNTKDAPHEQALHAGPVECVRGEQ